MSELKIRHDYIILDACCVINLYASGKMSSVLKSVPVRFAIADYVYEKEVLKIYTGPNNDVTQTNEAVNLKPFIDSKLVAVASPNCEDEFIDYIDFLANRLDDGEALTGAIAKSRNWGIGIDEKKGISFFTRETPQLQLVSTPELLKHWADTTNPSPEMLKTVILNIQNRARYCPNTRHSLYQWWENYGDLKYWVL